VQNGETVINDSGLYPWLQKDVPFRSPELKRVTMGQIPPENKRFQGIVLDDEAVIDYVNIDILSSDFSPSWGGKTRLQNENAAVKQVKMVWCGQSLKWNVSRKRRNVQGGTDTIRAARYDPPGPAASFPDDIKVFKTGAETARVPHGLDGR